MSVVRSAPKIGAFLLAATVSVLPGQVRPQAEGTYQLTLFGHDSLSRPRALGHVVVVLTSGPIPGAIAARLHSVFMDTRAPAVSHGACWRSLEPATAPTYWSAHSSWRTVGSIITVALWRSPDAGDELRMVNDGAHVRGEVSRWRFDGSETYDSLNGKRVGPPDPALC